MWKKVTLPKIGAPWKRRNSYWKPPFLGATLVSGRGNVSFSDVFFVFLPIRFAFPKGNSSSNHPFSGAMLNFQGVYVILFLVFKSAIWSKYAFWFHQTARWSCWSMQFSPSFFYWEYIYICIYIYTWKHCIYKLPKLHIDIKNAGFEHVSNMAILCINIYNLYVKFWGGNESWIMQSHQINWAFVSIWKALPFSASCSEQTSFPIEKTHTTSLSTN